uniref:NADH-ubiquinone oxidoreductase chain 2 n=1 Tax=Cheilonereis cyclurus TaxID=868083 RepID=A0A345WJZ0_9ANNE|nr:NADH dehydrogenase subunit 2 [Cheilonereis cyclurus]
MTPSSLLFLSSVMMGTMISMSSSNWLYLWMGMELNLLSFIPIMAHSNKLQETMGSIKYFMIQAIGSGLMLTAGISSVNPHTASNQFIISSMFIMSMCLKLGTAPFHQWLPHVMSSLPWSSCLLLATWQKISPLLMLVFITPNKMTLMILITAGLSALVGGVGGMNQSQMRALMAYSSIGHMGWMLTALTLSISLSLFYFSVYILITSSLMFMFLKTNTLMSQMSNSVIPSKVTMFYLTALILLSLGGLPPFLGFIPKWLIMYSLTEDNMIGILIILISGSMINLFYYFSMMFNFMLTPQQNLLTQAPPLWPLIITSTVTILPIMTLL